MMSSTGNIFRVTGHLCGEFTGPRWSPGTKVSDAELWCFLWSAPENKLLSKQPWGWWFEMPSHPLWRHCNVSMRNYQSGVGDICESRCPAGIQHQAISCQNDALDPVKQRRSKDWLTFRGLKTVVALYWNLNEKTQNVFFKNMRLFDVFYWKTISVLFIFHIIFCPVRNQLRKWLGIT